VASSTFFRAFGPDFLLAIIPEAQNSSTIAGVAESNRRGFERRKMIHFKNLPFPRAAMSR
jgi:hypothetical protein